MGVPTPTFLSSRLETGTPTIVPPLITILNMGNSRWQWGVGPCWHSWGSQKGPQAGWRRVEAGIRKPCSPERGTRRAGIRPGLPPISLNLEVCAHGRRQGLHCNHKEPSRQRFKTCGTHTQVSCWFSEFPHIEQEALLWASILTLGVNPGPSVALADAWP